MTLSDGLEDHQEGSSPPSKSKLALLLLSLVVAASLCGVLVVAIWPELAIYVHLVVTLVTALCELIRQARSMR
jgi:hypothetical protein